MGSAESAAGRARLLLEAAAAFGIGGRADRENLERHRAAEARVAGFVDHTHAAFAELLSDLVRPKLLADHADHSLAIERTDNR